MIVILDYMQSLGCADILSL